MYISLIYKYMYIYSKVFHQSNRWRWCQQLLSRCYTSDIRSRCKRRRMLSRSSVYIYHTSENLMCRKKYMSNRLNLVSRSLLHFDNLCYNLSGSLSACSETNMLRRFRLWMNKYNRCYRFRIVILMYISLLYKYMYIYNKVLHRHNQQHWYQVLLLKYCTSGSR